MNRFIFVRSFLLLLRGFGECIQTTCPLKARMSTCLVRPGLHLLMATCAVAECCRWSCVCAHTGTLLAHCLQVEHRLAEAYFLSLCFFIFFFFFICSIWPIYVREETADPLEA